MIRPQLRHVAAWAAVASSTLPTLASAQESSDVLNLNLTLRFLPSSSSSDSSCAYSSTNDALTFTTESVPAVSHCFNLAELFGGNATSGFVNQSNPAEWQESGIHWRIENEDTFDPQANYSQVLYRQAEYGQEEGSYAARRVNLYGGLNCTQADPEDKYGLTDWYGLSCWSGEEGDCEALPIRVMSFRVLPVPEDEDGSCLVYAQLGAGVGIYQPFKAAAGLLVGAAVAGWLAL